MFCGYLPNVKGLHTRFSLGEAKAGDTLPLGHRLPPHGPQGVKAEV